MILYIKCDTSFEAINKDKTGICSKIKIKKKKKKLKYILNKKN